MSYFDSLSLFSDNFEQRVADPVELGRQLFEHRMEADYVKTAIVELGTVAQFKARARKLTPAAKTLAGETAISWLFGVGGRASWGEFALTVKRAHKMAGSRNGRVLRQLEDAGVIVVSFVGRDRMPIVSLSYDLWLPAEIIPALPEAATTHELMRAENSQRSVAGAEPPDDIDAIADSIEVELLPETTPLRETGAFKRILDDLSWLDRNVRLDPPLFAADFLGDVERQLAKLVDDVSEGTI